MHRLVLVLLGFAVVSSACSDKKPCRLNSDCAFEERCVRNECTVLCREDRDCLDFESCIQGVCKGLIVTGGGPGGGGGGSSSDAGTDAGVDAGAGGGGGTTGGGGGIVGGGLGGGGATGGGSTGGGAATGGGGLTGGGATGGGGVTGGGAATGGGGGPMDAGNGMGQYGDACQGASDCMSGLCVGNAVTGLRMCTKQCANENACDPSQACLPVQSPQGGTINICIPSDSGEACPSGQPTTCIAGICLVHPGNISLSVCATPCQSARACPNGYSCSAVNVGGNLQKVCSPQGGQCGAQGVSNQCISRWCSTSALTPTAGVCLGHCTTAADCPTGFACGWDDAASGVVDRCQPVGLACTVDGMGNNNCLSKTCAQGTPQGDYCVAFCMDTSFNPQPQRCPPNWSCINEGSVADPLWVCEQ